MPSIPVMPLPVVPPRCAEVPGATVAPATDAPATDAPGTDVPATDVILLEPMMLQLPQVLLALMLLEPMMLQLLQRKHLENGTNGLGSIMEESAGSACVVGQSPSRSVLQRSVQFGFPEVYCARVGGATAGAGACLGLQAAFVFLLSVIGRTCPLKDTPNGSLQNGIIMGGLHYTLNASPPTLQDSPK